MARAIGVGVVGAAFLLLSCAAQAQRFTAINLGTLGAGISGTPAASYAFGINDSGQVTGYSTDTDSFHAFLTDAATHVMIDLGGEGYYQDDSYGAAVNASGQVTGYGGDGKDSNTPTHAFVTNAATNALTDLGTLGCGTSFNCNGSSYGTAINTSGQVVGYSSIATGVGTYHAFITDPTTNAMTDLGTLGGWESEAYGINDIGQITGWSLTTTGALHAFVTGASATAMTDLGTLGGSQSRGLAINARGQVTGWSNVADGSQHAFITNATTNAMTDLGTLGGANSQGLALNARGQVVGWSNTVANVQHGFLYMKGQMHDLNSLLTPQAASLYTITSATGINKSGQIAAQALVNATNENVALLLNPIIRKK